MSVARWLLEHGANVNLPNQQGSRSTPLHVAVDSDDLNVADLLLSMHADLTIEDANDRTASDLCRSDAMKSLLKKYGSQLSDDQSIEVHLDLKNPLWEHKEKSIMRAFLPHDAKKRDLEQLLPSAFRRRFGVFTISGHVLQFENGETTILNGACRSRYCRSQFIETPLHLTYNRGILPSSNRSEIRHDSNDLDHSQLERALQKNGKHYLINLQKSIDTVQVFQVGEVRFDFGSSVIRRDVQIKVQYLSWFDFEDLDLSSCLGLFKITYESPSVRRVQAFISDDNDHHCRLYSFTNGSSCWIAPCCETSPIPLADGIHGLFAWIAIIPHHLFLPLDLFFACSLSQPLISRADPVPCQCLQVRPHRPEIYPTIVYHGTLITNIRSILIDGLVLPETVISNGKFIQPPRDHIQLKVQCGQMDDYANGLFFSSNVFYSGRSGFAREFHSSAGLLVCILECSVKADSNTMSTAALPSSVYSAVFRLDNPSNVEINSVLFIRKNLIHHS